MKQTDCGVSFVNNKKKEKPLSTEVLFFYSGSEAYNKIYPFLFQVMPSTFFAMQNVFNLFHDLYTLSTKRTFMKQNNKRFGMI